MKRLILTVIVFAIIGTGVCEAGLIFRRKQSGRATPARNGVGRVFGGCANGSCR